MPQKDIFKDVKEYREFKSKGISWKLPILYRRLDAFSIVYTADWNAVKAVMPSERFGLYRISPGRTLVMLSAFNYLETDVGHYGEFGVSVPAHVTHEGKKYRGLYIYHLPVTTEVARIAGVECYGFPKFVAKIEHKKIPNEYSVSISEGGARILDMTMAKGGLSMGYSGEVGLFTVKDKEIIYTEFIAQALARARPFGKGSLKLGDHKMANDIKALGLGNKPLGTADMLDASLVLPEGKSIGHI